MSTLLRNVATYLTQILHESQFYEHGVLTPEEFVLAGDTLVTTFGTWQWASPTSITKFVSYLPKSKQYLITKNVPSFIRASKFQLVTEDQILDDDTQTVWNLPSLRLLERNIREVNHCESGATAEESDCAKNIPSLEDFGDDGNSCKSPPSTCVNDSRSYDISITYDKFYRTPRIYFVGYDEFGGLLSFSQISQDVSSDHLNKTVTLEPHPHTGLTHLSIHPCKHAHTMKRMLELVHEQQLENLRKSGHSPDDIETAAADALRAAVPVHHYIFLFLKFINVIIPTIEYDFTTNFL
uniref:Ubiquitin-like-conjugating enzyme ATG3 n=2 Tax=Lygus hesperus TaxID=30085 RepID=A0A146LAH1_LYGHE